ncbi:MAG: sel1 repeat family protein [Muribaculaceae bacterium]|nr:sel1 repeat family protein [Muribaculaceae bacterium]
MESRNDPIFEVCGPVKSITYHSTYNTIVNKNNTVYEIDLCPQIYKVNYFPTGERWFVFDHLSIGTTPVYCKEENGCLFFEANTWGDYITCSYLLDDEKGVLAEICFSHNVRQSSVEDFDFCFNYDDSLKLTNICHEYEYARGTGYHSVCGPHEQSKCTYVVGHTEKDKYGNWIKRELCGDNDTVVVSRTIEYYSQEEITQLSSVMTPENLGRDCNEVYKILYNAAILGDEDAVYGLAFSGLPDCDVWLEKVAANGNVEAQYQLGMTYYNNYKDYKRAFPWFLQAANLGHAESQAMVGLFHFYGITEAGYSDEEAVSWFKKSITNKEVGIALFYLGMCYLNGYGVLQDKEVAADYFYRCGLTNTLKKDCFLTAAGLGNIQAMTKCEEFSYEDPSYVMKAAELGSSEAQYAVGKYYEEYGDSIEMINMYNVASSSGNAQATAALARCYYNGIGVTRDYKTAYELSKKALEKIPNNAEALIVLADCYKNGYVVKQDLTKAGDLYYEASSEVNIDDKLLYLTKAADLGHEKAMTQIVEKIDWYIETDEEKDSIITKYALMNNVKAIEAYAEEKYYSRDFDGAFQLFKSILDKNSGQSKYYLAQCYFYGKGVKQDYTMARELLESYLNSNKNEEYQHSAYCMLGSIYENGQGITKDFSKAIRCYLHANEYSSVAKLWRKVASQNNTLTKQEIKACKKIYDKFNDEISLESVETEQQIMTLKNAAVAGNKKAQNLLARHYTENKPVNYVEAVKWNTLVAEQGDVEAMKFLAACYEKGMGVARDGVEALKWYKKAAIIGDNRSCMIVAKCYEEGINGCPKNPNEAFKWYLAAEYFPDVFSRMNNIWDGDLELYAETQRNIARCYLNGIGVEKNYEKAISLYKEAFDCDTIHSQNERFNALLKMSTVTSASWGDLGLCYFYGWGTRINYTKAFKWLSKAVEANEPHFACYYDDWRYPETLNCPSQGDAEAGKMYFCLGYCYDKGLGVKKSKSKAVEMYILAAKNCNREAQEILSKRGVKYE